MSEKQLISRDEVLKFFREKTRKPLDFREAVATMGLHRAGARALKKVLRALVREGELVRTKNGRYGVSDEMNVVTGYFEAHAEGFGFVINDKLGTRDLFVPAKAALTAMNNDRVVARVEDERRRKGRIIRVLDRFHTRVAGTVDLSGGACFVKPKVKAAGFDVYLPPGEREGISDKDIVLVEIVDYPIPTRPATGRLIKVLGRPGTPKAEITAIVEEFGLTPRFPKKVLEEAAALRDMEPGERRDLRGLMTVTIDGERARDFDDAVSVRREAGGYTLWVHIADVGFYVGWDTQLDLEARKRGTSVYFPDRVVPMLPKELSEDLCSLRPREDRAAFTAEMRFDGEGRRLGARFYESLINSDERMTYTSVRKILIDREEREREKFAWLAEDLELMGELANLLRARRMERGSLDFDLPEPEVLLDMRGSPEAIIRAERNAAHEMIEDFMIAANEAVAEFLASRGVPSLYRVHEEPDPVKVSDLMRLARPLLRKGRRPRELHQLLMMIKGTPEEEMVTLSMLRSLKQARYSTENVGHFGLASECYTHFTSPIRRYPDLVVHRILREALRTRRLEGRRVEQLLESLGEIAFHSSRRERMADEAEREAMDAMRAWFMKDKVGGEFEARVIGVTPYGLRLRLREYYVEGFLHVSSLADDYYRYEEQDMSLRGRNTQRAFRIGNEMRVRLKSVDLIEREMAFVLVGQGG